MFEMKTPLRRLAAGVGAFALAAAGLIGVGTAHADEGDPVPVLTGDIVGTQGTLVVHKHKGDPGAGTAGNGSALDPAPADPLQGVEFTVKRVGHTSQNPIDLHTSEGWDLAATATPTNVTSAPFSLGAGTSLSTDANGVASFTLDHGLYLVTETNPGTNPIVSPVAPFLVSVPYPAANEWLYTVHVYPKNKLNETVPTKTVEDPGNQLAVGDDVVWTVTAPVPALATGDVFDKFVISDDFDDRLTLDTARVVVKLDGVTLVAGTDYTITPAAGTEEVGPATVITLTGALANLPGKQNVVVTYTTKVKELGSTPYFENQAFVNANDTTKNTDKPRVNYGSLKVIKHNAGNPTQTLAGAQFELYDAKNGTRVAGPVSTGPDGSVTIAGIWVGVGTDITQDYWLKEIKAPAGYVTPTGDAAWTQVTITGGEGSTVVQKAIANTKQQGPGLPLTGGVGTAVFGGAGLALVLIAIASSAALRRRHAAR